ncbi:MAG TPA: hypothetical protein VF601_03155 [Beijerinckiaceae bacterium]
MRIAGLIAPVLLGLLATACVETGDFGRPRPSFWNDVVLPTTGSLAATARGEPVSSYVFTDDEEELRRRAWRFIMPAHERTVFEGRLAGLAGKRILPMSFERGDRANYFRALMRDGGSSPASRYHRLSEDAASDAKLIDPFATVAARVVQADGMRLKSLAFVQDLTTDDARQAALRVAENRCLIAWVRVEVARRAASYRFALEHLFVEAPQREGIAAERALAWLDAHRGAIDALPGGPWAIATCGVPPAFAVAETIETAPAPPVVAKD